MISIALRRHVRAMLGLPCDPDIQNRLEYCEKYQITPMPTFFTVVNMSKTVSRTTCMPVIIYNQNYVYACHHIQSELRVCLLSLYNQNYVYACYHIQSELRVCLLSYTIRTTCMPVIIYNQNYVYACYHIQSELRVCLLSYKIRATCMPVIGNNRKHSNHSSNKILHCQVGIRW